MQQPVFYIPGLGEGRFDVIRYTNSKATIEIAGDSITVERSTPLQRPLFDNVVSTKELPENKILLKSPVGPYNRFYTARLGDPLSLLIYLLVRYILLPLFGKSILERQLPPYFLLFERDLRPHKFIERFASETLVQHELEVIRTVLTDLADEERLIIYGFSRGASTALALLPHFTDAERRRIAAVVAESPFHDIKLMADLRWGWLGSSLMRFYWWLCNGGPSVSERLQTHEPRNVSLPVLIVSGQKDVVTPPQCQHELAAILETFEWYNVTLCELPRTGHLGGHDGEDASLYYECIETVLSSSS